MLKPGDVCIVLTQQYHKSLHYIHYTFVPDTVLSRYYDVCFIEMLLITIPNLYPYDSQTMEI